MLHFLLRHNQYSVINAFKLYCFISHQDGTSVMSWSLLSFIYCWDITTTVSWLLLMYCSGLFIIQTYPIQYHGQWCFIAVLHLILRLPLQCNYCLCFYCFASFVVKTITVVVLQWFIYFEDISMTVSRALMLYCSGLFPIIRT